MNQIDIEIVRSYGTIVTKLINDILQSEEERFYDELLIGLAIFIAQQTCNGHKSAAQGVDLEFINRNTHFIVSIKSGPNWGNSSQQQKLAQDLRDGVTRVRQSRTALNVQPVLGICYGKVRTKFSPRGYLKVVGQNFWFLISENPDLYTEIIEPIGFRAREHNALFVHGRGALQNKLTGEFISQYCDENGAIDWVHLVQVNSHNLDLTNFLPEN